MTKQFPAVCVLGLVACGLGLSGCYSSATDIMAFYKPEQVAVTAEDYRILPPDEIQVLCTNVPEIHDSTQTVRQDGKVSFEVVGEIEIAGKTPAEAAELIRERVAGLYNLSGVFPVDVRVVESRSHHIYVYGEVQRPGPQPYTGRDNLIHAVNRAVPMVTAYVTRIRVIRPSSQENESPRVFLYNLNRLLYKGEGNQTVLLQPGDIVYVQPTILARVGKFIGQLVAPVAQAASPALTIQRLSVGSP